MQFTIPLSIYVNGSQARRWGSFLAKKVHFYVYGGRTLLGIYEQSPASCKRKENGKDIFFASLVPTTTKRSWVH